ncbi:MAG: hypothetical protein Q9178_007138 [Gyalolechia marmorata]
MQSFRQYRRFGRHIQAQYERDQGKAKAIGEEKIHDTSDSTSPQSSTTPHAAEEIPFEDNRDLEKGEQTLIKRVAKEMDYKYPLSTHSSRTARCNASGLPHAEAVVGA